MREQHPCTEIWRRYEAGREHHRRAGLYREDERCHRFYEGEQWFGLQAGGEELPTLNFIRPICKYKVTTVAMNDTAIIYSPQSDDADAAAVCDLLTRFAAVQWEHCGMDALKWRVIRGAAITGDHYLYCYEEPRAPGLAGRGGPRLAMRAVDRSAVYLADEQEADLDRQEWILMAERRPVAQIRREAKNAGLPADRIARILPDEADDTQVGSGQEDEVESGEGKCTSLLMLRLGPDGLRFCRSTREVVYGPEQCIPGLRHYPLCGMRWEERQGSARGVGVVGPLIPNQIEVNRTLARRAISVKRFSFPTAVYDQDRLTNPDALGRVGASLKVKNLAGSPLSALVQYLTPVGVGADAAALQSELVTLSRELEGRLRRGDRAGGPDAGQRRGDQGRPRPERAGPQRADRRLPRDDRAAGPDLAGAVGGLRRRGAGRPAAGGRTAGVNRVVGLPAGMLGQLEVEVRIDLSPVDPYSVLSRQMALENALSAGWITFEEYVGALDRTSGAPRDKFRAILERRAARGEKDPSGSGAAENTVGGGADDAGAGDSRGRRRTAGRAAGRARWRHPARGR